MADFEDKKKGGCLKGCLWVFVGFIAVAILVSVVVVKVVLPQVTAKFLVSQMKSNNTGMRKLTQKDIDGVISVLDKIDDKKLRSVMDELAKRPITNSRETVDFTLNRLGIEGISPTDRAAASETITPAQLSNMVSAYRQNPMASSMSMGVLKGLIRDTLVEMKKQTPK